MNTNDNLIKASENLPANIDKTDQSEIKNKKDGKLKLYLNAPVHFM